MKTCKTFAGLTGRQLIEMATKTNETEPVVTINLRKCIIVPYSRPGGELTVCDWDNAEFAKVVPQYSGPTYMVEVASE